MAEYGNLVKTRRGGRPARIRREGRARYASLGADRMVEVASSMGKTVFHDIATIPPAS
jgi:hypothetical protein